MKWLLASIGLIGALTAGASIPQTAAAAARKGGEQCFFARNMTSFAPVGREKLNIRVGVNDYYQIDLLGTCQDLDWSQRIGLQSRGSDWICSGLDVTIIVPSQIGPQRCNASSIHKLTPAEVAAIPKKEKP